MLKQESSPQRLIFSWYATSIDNTVAEIDIYLQAAYGLIRIAENTYAANKNERALELCREIISKMNECKDSFIMLKTVYHELCNCSSPTEPIAEKLEKYETFRQNVENNFEITKRCYNSIKRLLNDSAVKVNETIQESTVLGTNLYKGDAPVKISAEAFSHPNVTSIDVYRSISNVEPKYISLSSQSTGDKSHPKPPLRKSLPNRPTSSKSGVPLSSFNLNEALASTPLISSDKNPALSVESGYFSSNSNQIPQKAFCFSQYDDENFKSTEGTDDDFQPRYPRVSRKSRDSVRSNSFTVEGVAGEHRMPRVSRKTKEFNSSASCNETECLGNRYNSYHIQFCKNLQDFVQDCITALQPYITDHNVKTMQSLN